MTRGAVARGGPLGGRSQDPGTSIYYIVSTLKVDAHKPSYVMYFAVCE